MKKGYSRGVITYLYVYLHLYHLLNLVSSLCVWLSNCPQQKLGPLWQDNAFAKAPLSYHIGLPTWGHLKMLHSIPDFRNVSARNKHGGYTT